MSDPSPVTRFFGAALIAVGFLMMLLCGGCGAIFLVFFVIDGVAHPNDLMMSIMTPLLLGGIPAAIGFGLFVAGRNLRRDLTGPTGAPPTSDEP